MKMPAQSGPLASVTIGPQSWRDETVRSIRRAEDLVRQSHAWRIGSDARCRSLSVAAFSFKRAELGTDDMVGDPTKENRDVDPQTKLKVRPVPTETPFHSKTSFIAPIPPPCLWDHCAEVSSGLARGYMRSVREVEGHLRRQAGRVTQEGTRLERERERVEKLLRSLRKAAEVNRKSADGRNLRPATTETGRDGADHLLDRERKELSTLKQELQAMLRNTFTQLQALGQCSKQLLACAFERSRVMELLPHSTPSAGASRPPHPVPVKPDPASPLTPECKQVLEYAKLVVTESQQLRENIRHKIGDAVNRQEASHHSVNEGLVKKITETVNLGQHLTMSSAAARQAIYRKQRQMQCIDFSHGRALGPVSSEDLFIREKLRRPLVQVYQRHASLELPESAHLRQGGAVLRQYLQASGRELVQLQGARLQLVADLHGKRAAARVDSAIVRQRRLPITAQLATS